MEENIYFKRDILEIKDIEEENLYQEHILKYINDLVLYSLKNGGSDIHFESREKDLRVRVRIDGTLKEFQVFNKSFGIKILSKIKILTELDIGEKRLPQDGRFKGKYGEEEIDFRVSFIPTIFGEKCVVRILINNASKLDLNTLGFNNQNLKTIYEAIERKSGLLLFCGPTGSGKTTTLYSIINYLNKEEVNIVTIEDPIEYQLLGINQIQCKSEIGLNFSTILRSVLRQDPDIILIGEIRDFETAEIALMASLTGHLVLSTLHTKDSISAIDRLVGFGIDKYTIASGLSLVQSQRLVRKICKICFGKDINCEKCNDGFKGREAVEEIIFFNEEIRKILIEENSSKKLKEYLKKNNFKSILENGKEKITKKITTEKEIIKECSI
ncbi:GspE/PulE family protein [uncultured Cetobacterium sp.]|uniref:GspE/PulE family protein n=1 Tax=uncultured Cetobacterium sp. TaxID=527638 RepID=UPI002607BBCD|nr:GspE/PulE family protein [uncultured Cetobacterium sp.]